MRFTLLFAIACGRLGFDPQQHGGADDGSSADGSSADGAIAPSCASFGTPVRMPDIVQSAGHDWEPALDPRGVTLVFGSNRLDTASNTTHLFRTDFIGGTWSAPAQILSTGGSEGGPEWNAAGDTLYFNSDATGGPRIYTASFDGASFGPPQLVPGLDATDAESIGLSHDESEMFFTTPDNGGTIASTLVRAVRHQNGTWDVVGPVSELNHDANDGWPTLSVDGLTIYYEVNIGSDAADIYVAHRDTIGAPFDDAAPVSAIDTPKEDGDPQVRVDGMLFASSRANSVGDNDLYQAPCN